VKDILVALIPLAFLITGCGKQNSIIKAHNQMVAVESSMVDFINSAGNAGEQAAAVETALNSIQKIDVSECPHDYQVAWQEVIQTWKKLATALKNRDIVLAEQLIKESPVKTSTLNRIAQSHGVQMAD